MAKQNQEIAGLFEEIADLLEIENANPFRVRAYRNAARTIRGLSRELLDLANEGTDLTTLPGIGHDLDAKIHEILASGHSAMLDRLHRETPVSVENLLKLPGLGPKRVGHLYHEMGVQNIAQLETAARSGRLRALPGFGAKLEQGILENIQTLRSKQKRFLRPLATRIAEALVRYLKRRDAVRQAVVAGSYRRGKDTVGDLDILVTTSDPARVMDHFVGYQEVDRVVSRGQTRASVILDCGMPVDLRVVEEKSFGSALHYFTGSKSHNIRARRLAQRQGLKINEYGVFRGEERLARESEESVFKAIGLGFIPPELREDRGEIKAALANRIPSLVERSDLRGDLHAHTSATDGHATILEMAQAARRYGLEYLAITDHSRHLTVADGLNAGQLSRQIDEIDRLNSEIEGITLLKGIEVDILEDGRLDLVVAAAHSQFHLSRKKQTDRILRAMDQRCFTILAHPSGRLLLEREAYDFDVRKIIRKARERGCFLELNSQPLRLDLSDLDCRNAIGEGVLISIASDAHSENDFQNLTFGVDQARRGWLEKKDVLNTRPLKMLKPMLQRTLAWPGGASQRSGTRCFLNQLFA